MRYQGLLYRALNPIYAKEPLSGRGAELYGGRFNAKGTAALYLSIEVLTAVREANQVGTLQPTTMVAYEADIEDLFDCRDPSALFTHGWSPDDLAALPPVRRASRRANADPSSFGVRLCRSCL